MRLRFAALTVFLGCGPSFPAIYEGNARFEHCYALEESPQSNMRQRADCWRDWSENYTYGQTRDRIQYATARYVALSQAPNIPTDEALMMAAPGMTPRVSTISAPAPTNPFAPPPKVLEQEGGILPTERPSDRNPVLGIAPDAATPPAPIATPEPVGPPEPPLPRASCADTCASAFRSCDAGTTCQKTYRGCMRACFK